jgi:hypothetical protein
MWRPKKYTVCNIRCAYFLPHVLYVKNIDKKSKLTLKRYLNTLVLVLLDNLLRQVIYLYKKFFFVTYSAYFSSTTINILDDNQLSFVI